MAQLIPPHIELSSVDIWQQDESRVGQQGSLCRVWAPTGTRPRKVRQQQFISTYIYGAACAKTGQSFGLILPCTNIEAMQIFLAELSKQISYGRHVALVIDNAGWHTAKALITPSNITLIPLPAYSPELNAMEQVWEWIKLNYLSNCNFKNYDEIVDKVCFAWNQFAQQANLVKSLCARVWLTTP